VRACCILRMKVNIDRFFVTGFIKEDGSPGDRFQFKSLKEGAAT
jgi:hypothetical protein